MELVGFKVDRVYVTRFLKRKMHKEIHLRKTIEEFFKDKNKYIKGQAVKQYRNSNNPVEKFEYLLDQRIGPTRMKENMKKAQEISLPD